MQKRNYCVQKWAQTNATVFSAKSQWERFVSRTPKRRFQNHNEQFIHKKCTNEWHHSQVTFPNGGLSSWENLQKFRLEIWAQTKHKLITLCSSWNLYWGSISPDSKKKGTYTKEINASTNAHKRHYFHLKVTMGGVNFSLRSSRRFFKIIMNTSYINRVQMTLLSRKITMGEVHFSRRP